MTTSSADTAGTATSRHARSAGEPRHAGLDRDDVIDAALALVEAHGGAALTMRKLAAELGVAPNSIYWHVGNRDELVLAVVRRQAERQAAVPVTGDGPHERVLCAARNIWATALAHRNVTALASAAGATTLLELPLEVALLEELEAAGLHGAPARDTLRAVLACIAGFLIIAWRRDDVADELRPATLWAGVEDAAISAETRQALRTPSELDSLLDTTLRSVIAGALIGVERSPEP